MSFFVGYLVLLAALSLHFYAPFNVAVLRVRCIAFGVHFLLTRVSSKIQAHNALSLGLIVLLPLATLLALNAVLKWLLFYWLYAFFCIIVLWFCLDVNDGPQESIEGVLQYRLQGSYLPFLAFILFGITGLIVVRVLVDSHDSPLLNVFSQGVLKKIVGYLQWLPERLLGFSFGLVGYFQPVFSVWLRQFYLAPSDQCPFLVECIFAAMGPKDLGDSSADVRTLIFHAAVFWLMLTAIISFVTLF